MIRRFSPTRAKEQAIRFLLFLCALLSVATTVGIIFVLVTEAVVAVGPNTAFFQEVSVKEFFTETRWTPQFSEQHFGVLPLLAGTFLIAGIAALIALPVGLASAIYLSEYASPRARNFIKPTLELLAGIPTIVYGYFALVFVTPYLLRPIFQDWLGFDVDVFNAASAGIVVGIMILPMVSSLSEDALRAVPRGLREAGYALGSTKLDVSVKVVLPAASSGIAASFLLAVSRAVGETMAVTIAAGMTPALTLNPFRSVQTMTSYIVNVSLGDTPAGSIAYQSLYAIALTLFCITLAMNVLSQFVLRRFREVYE
ncbi:MAG: phosphate ABC transporter permease subunit PstC [Planctomycetota bacterium]|nr:phosphate ABC transporter permease subunit PstC [Planctomycetota bacterium]